MMVYPIIITSLVFVAIFFLSTTFIPAVYTKLRAINSLPVKQTSTAATITSLLQLIRTQPKLKPVKNIKLFTSLISATGGYLFLGNWFWFIVFAVFGYFLPRFVADYNHRQYINRFEQQLADTLLFISNALRAGASFPQAVETVVQQTAPPMSGELRDVLKEVSLGVPMATALDNFAKRVPSRELQIAVTAINIIRETGGNLSEILGRITETIQERRRIQGRIDVLTTQGKMSGYVVGALPFILMLVLNLIDPSLIQPLFNTIPGYAMLTVIIVLVTLGGLMIRKIINIDI